MANKKITYGIDFKVDQKGLKDVQNELKKISTMTNDGLRLYGAKDSFNKIKQSAKELEGILERSFNPKLGVYNMQTLKKEMQNLGKDGARSLKDIERELNKTGSLGGSTFRNFASAVMTTNNELAKGSELLASMGKTLGNTIKWSISSSIINTFTGAIQKAWGYTQKLDESLNNIRIVTEKSNAEMEKFAKTANKAAKSLGASTTDYTNASLIYYQQGLSDKDVQSRTKTTIKAANVTGQSAAEVSEQLTAVWNGYKVVAEEAELYVDKLAAVAASTAADLEELSEGMSKVASAANAMGVDIDQLTAQISTIVSVTRQDAAVVGTALKTIYSRMGDLKVDGVDEFGTSLGDVSGQLQQMGIDVLDQEGNLRNMGTVIEEVAAKWGTWTEAQQQAAAVAIAGKRQYNNLLALFENWNMYESALSTSQNSEGTLQKQQDIYMDSLEAKLQKLRTSVEKVWDGLINSESTKKAIDVLAFIVEELGKLIEGFGGLGNIILILGTHLTRTFNGQIVDAIGKFGHNVSTVWKTLRGKNLANAKDLANEFNLNSKDPAVKEMARLRNEELKLSRYLTEEEKARYEFLIKQNAELANRKAELKQEGKDITSSALAYGVDLKAGDNFVEAKQHLAVKGNDFINSAKDTQKQLLHSNERGSATLSAVGMLEQETFSLLGEGTVAWNKMIIAQDEYNEGNLEAEEYIQSMIDAVQEAQQEVKQLEKDWENNKKEVKENEKELKDLKKSGQKMTDDQAKEKTANIVADAAATAMALWSVYNSMSNLIESMRQGEMTVESFIGNMISMMMGLIPAVTSSISALQASTTASLSTFQAKATAALGWIGLILAAVSLIFGLVKGLGVFEKKESELEKANKAVDKAKESAAAAREEYSKLTGELEELKDVINDLDVKKMELDSLIPGTVAYQKAVAELNQEILDLVEKYPQLAQFLKFEGDRFILAEGALENLQAQLEEKALNATLNISQKERDVLKAENEKIKVESKELWANETDYTGKVNMAYTKDNEDISDMSLKEAEALKSVLESDQYTIGTNADTGEMSSLSLDYDEILKLNTEELTTLRSSLGDIDTPLSRTIDGLLENNAQISTNNARIAELNSTYNKILAKELGWDTSAGSSVFDKAMKDAGKGTNSASDIAKSYDLDQLYDSSIKAQDIDGNRFGNYGKISNNTELKVVNGQLAEIAKKYNIRVTKYLQLDDVKKKKLSDIVNMPLLEVDGEPTSIDEFLTLAANEKNTGEGGDVNKLLQPYKAAAERSGLGEWAAGFGYTDQKSLSTKVLSYMNKDGMSAEAAMQKIQEEEFASDYASVRDSLTLGDVSGNLTYTTEDGQVVDLTKVKTEFLTDVKEKFQNDAVFGRMQELDAVQNFTLTEWENFGRAYSANSAAFTTEVLNDTATLSKIISLINNDKTVRQTYTNRLGVSAEFGQYQNSQGDWINKTGFSGLDIRNMVIDSYKLELDYTKKIAEEMDHAFGPNRLKLLKEMTEIQNNSASIAEGQFFKLVAGTVAADTSKFLDENGRFSYAKMLDYQAQLLADNGEDGEAYKETVKILDAYEKMEELSWAVVDAKIEEYHYQFEILNMLKETVKQWKDLQFNTQNWNQGISAFGQKNVINNIDHLKENFASSAEGLRAIELSALSDLTRFYNIDNINMDSFKKQWGGSGYITEGSKEEQDKAWEANKEYVESYENYVKGSLTRNDPYKEGGGYGYTYELWDMEKIKAFEESNPYLRWDTFNQQFMLNEAKLFEDYQENLNGAMSTLEEMISTVGELFNQWEDGLKEIQNTYDNVIDTVSDLNSIISSGVNATKIMGGAGISENLGIYYDLLIGANGETYQLKQKKVQDLLSTYQAAVKSENQQLIQSSKEALIAATNELTKYTEEQFDLISNKFKDMTSKAIDDALGEDGKFTQLSIAWELEKAKDEMFLDDINAQYGIDNIRRNFEKSINETDSIDAQNKLMEKQTEIQKRLNDLRDAGQKITQYDLDLANAEYELTLKQIALEEAQQVANKMKLVRDASGNYTYQYVQDQDAIATAEQELADAQNRLYNLEKDRKKELIDSYFSLMTEYQEKYAEAAATGNQDLMDSVYDYYFGNEGILTMLKGQLGAIEGDAENLNNLFDDGVFDFSNAIMNFDATGLQTIANETKTEIGTLKTTMEGLWGSESPLVQTIDAIADSIGITTKNDGSGEYQISDSWSQLNNTELIKTLIGEKDANGDYSGGLINTITDYMNQVTALEQQLAPYIEEYGDLFKNISEVDKNTDALTGLTAAAYDLLDQLEQGDNQGDGVYNGYERESSAGADGIFDWFPIVAGDK